MSRRKPELIGLAGYARAGKDTFADALVERCGYTKQSFAAPLRDMLYAQDPRIPAGVPHRTSASFQATTSLRAVVDVHGWEKAKDNYPEVRRLLQALGTEAGRKILGENVWVDAAMRRVAEAPTRHHVFADVRFPNEAQAIKDRGGIVIRITRFGGPLNEHESETALDDWTYDYVIRNWEDVNALRQQAFNVIAKEEGTYRWPHQRAAVADGVGW